MKEINIFKKNRSEKIFTWYYPNIFSSVFYFKVLFLMIHLPFFNSNILQSSIYFRRIRSEFENTRSITDPKIIKLKLGNVHKEFSNRRE